MTLIKNAEKLVLASASKIRSTLLNNAGLSFETHPADIDEHKIIMSYHDNKTVSISHVAEVLAIEKAKAISKLQTEAYIIGCDQILSFDDKMYSKPENEVEAFKRLKSFSGKTHFLHTAVSLVKNQELIWRYSEIVEMTMRELSDEFIQEYIDASGKEILKSVGAYQLEGLGVQLFSDIKGNYFTILGIPVLPLLQALRDKKVINQ